MTSRSSGRRADDSDRAMFPPLPQIRSQRIEQQIFTHRSYYGRPTHVFEDRPGDLSPDNERFEHLGDSVLGLIVTALMMDMYSGLHVGPLTKIRSMMVGNTTLAEISRRYGLHDRLRLHPAQAMTLRASVHIQADVFEAFIGGLYKDQGLEAVRAWLVPLFKPYTTEAYAMVREQYGLPPILLPTPNASPLSSSRVLSPPRDLLALSGEPPPTPPPGAPPTLSHLALFNQHVARMNRHVEWIYSDGTVAKLADALASGSLGASPSDVLRDGSRRRALEVLMAKGSKSTPVWFARVVVDGEMFGAGRGNTKKIARNEAAKQGLEKMGINLERNFGNGVLSRSV